MRAPDGTKQPEHSLGRMLRRQLAVIHTGPPTPGEHVLARFLKESFGESEPVAPLLAWAHRGDFFQSSVQGPLGGFFQRQESPASVRSR